MATPTGNLHKPSPLRTALQVVGFVLGLAALGACVYIVATNEQYRAQLRRLVDAPPATLAAIFGLSAATIFTSAMVFRATLRPIKRIPVSDAVSINALCTLLGNLPFKLSLVVRILIHTKRHQIPLATVLSWIAGTAVVILVSLGPAIAATLVLKRVDALWWAMTIGGTIVLAIAAVITSRWLAPPETWLRLTARLPGPLARLCQRPFVIKLHHGLRTLAEPRAVAEALLWRGIDLSCQVLRFWLVAQVLGVEMSWTQCLIAGVTYFILQGASPAGALGAREGGTAVVLSQLAGAEALAVVLAVTAVESATNLVLGLVGAAYLRIDRLLRS